MTTVTPPPAFPIHHLLIPYTKSDSKLQTLDVWLPRPLTESDPNKTVWIVYVHGGAWRDPAQDSLCILPTLSNIEPSDLKHIAGVVSLNYRLSPYTSHSTDPSSPSDPYRNVRHPSHIKDVESARKMLYTKYGIGSTRRWIGVGHSCGATLLMQLVASIGLAKDEDGDNEDALAGEGNGSGPSALILLEGIYDLPLFLRNHQPPLCPPEIAKIYRDIVVGAFGPDEAAQDTGEARSVWQAASPTHGAYLSSSCPSLRLISLCHAATDELVEVDQRVVMVERLKEEGWLPGQQTIADKKKRAVEIRDLEGTHDGIWEDGQQIADLIVEIAGRVAEL